MSIRKRRASSPQVEQVAGNGLLNRRALLRGGAVVAGAITSGGALTGAAAEPLQNDPWSLERGLVVPAYQVPSRFEKDVVRTLSNPNNEFRNSHARTPHQLLQGAITPNGLFFSICHSALPDIDPAQHKLVIHGLVKQPLVYTLDSLSRYPMVTRTHFLECSGNSAPMFSSEPLQVTAQAIHGLVSNAEWTGVLLSTLLEETGIDPKATWLLAEGPDAPASARLPGQHECQICASHQAHRPAGHELLRIQDLLADPSDRQDVAVPFHPGGEIVHHPPVVRPCVAGAGLLRDFRRRLFGQRPHFQGDGLGRRRQELGAGGAAGAGDAEGVRALPHAVALGWPAGRPAEPRLR